MQLSDGARGPGARRFALARAHGATLCAAASCAAWLGAAGVASADGASAAPPPSDPAATVVGRTPTHVGFTSEARFETYVDDDGLVIFAPALRVSQEVGESVTVGAGYAADRVSAATVDVRTEASTRWHETRQEGSFTGSVRLPGTYLTLGAGYQLSRENDYLSHTLSASYSHELLQRNLTLGASYALVLSDVYRSGTPHDVFAESATIHALNLSLTQVVGRGSVAQLLYTALVNEGFQSSVYRHVPVFLASYWARVTAAGVPLDEDTLLDGVVTPAARPLEAVPDARTRHAARVRWVQALGEAASAHLAYRFYTDTWGLHSHTAEVELFHELPGGLLARLRERVYTQGAASFYRRVYVVDSLDTLPRYRTTDRELSPFWANVAGAKLEWERKRLGALALLRLGAKVDYHHAWYSSYAYLAERGAWVTTLGVDLEF